MASWYDRPTPITRRGFSPNSVTTAYIQTIEFFGVGNVVTCKIRTDPVTNVAIIRGVRTVASPAVWEFHLLALDLGDFVLLYRARR